MFQVFMISFREGLEALLIVAVAASYLSKVGLGQLMSAVQAGVIVSLLGCTALGYWLVQLGGLAPAYEGLLALLAAALVGSFTVYVIRMDRRLIGQLCARILVASSKKTWLGIFLFVLFMVGREGVELVSMLISIGRDNNALPMVTPALLGLLSATVLSLLWVKYGNRINLFLFLRVTSVFMLLFCAQLLVLALSEFAEVGLVPGVNNEALHHALEPLGPAGEYGVLYSLVLLAVPLFFLLDGMFYKLFRTRT